MVQGFLTNPDYLNPNRREEQARPNRQEAPHKGRNSSEGGRIRAGILLSGVFLALCVLLSGSPSTQAASLPYGEHYSPRENLEKIDIRALSMARHSIDIAMYAFTDREIARTLARMAGKGVKIRLYRDRMQIRDKNDRSLWLLRQSPRIRIRIKRNSSRNIMHLKAYLVDGRILRTGSANWSPPGEGAWCSRGERLHRDQQDNNLFITNDLREVRKFESTFRRIWTRETNRPWNENLSRRRS